VQEARQILRGVFVSDDLANQLAFEAVEKVGAAGFILDGYPRSVAQAEALEQFLEARGLALSRVLLFHVSEATLEGRVQGRRVCDACGATYHLQHLQESLCDLCGGALRARSEDSTAHKRSVRRHFYETRLASLRLFYQKRHLLTEVSAEGSPERVYNNICENLRSLI
jgi:adenylate kinase